MRPNAMHQSAATTGLSYKRSSALFPEADFVPFYGDVHRYSGGYSAVSKSYYELGPESGLITTRERRVSWEIHTCIPTLDLKTITSDGYEHLRPLQKESSTAEGR